MTLKSRLRVTQGHWKRKHWIDHTQLTISRVIWRWILSRPWNVGEKVTESSTIWKLGYEFLFAFIVTICGHFGDIQLTLKSGFGVLQGHWKWRGLIGHVWLSIRHCDYTSTLYHLRVIWRWIIPWPWNLA